MKSTYPIIPCQMALKSPAMIMSFVPEEVDMMQMAEIPLLSMVWTPLVPGIPYLRAYLRMLSPCLGDEHPRSSVCSVKLVSEPDAGFNRCHGFESHSLSCE